MTRTSLNRRLFLALPFVSFFAAKFKQERIPGTSLRQWKGDAVTVAEIKRGTVVNISKEMTYFAGKLPSEEARAILREY